MLPIIEKEHDLSLNFRLTSTKPAPNDLVFYITDQYETALPLFAIPMGGPPRHQYDTKVSCTDNPRRPTELMSYSSAVPSRPALRRGAPWSSWSSSAGERFSLRAAAP